MMNKNDNGKKRVAPFKAAVRWLWRLFSSVRLAVTVIVNRNETLSSRI